MKERMPHIPEDVLYYTEQEGRKNAALISQGQGTQEVGMGGDLYRAYPEVKNLYDQSSFFLRGILGGRSLLDLTEDDFKRTDLTQIAIFVHSEACRIAFIKQREEKGEEPINPKFYAGNSAGQNNALYAAGAFVSLRHALYFVLNRGTSLQNACEQQKSGLAAISAEKTVLKEVVKYLTDHKTGCKLYLEADNSVKQSVVGGLNEDMDKAEAWINEHPELSVRFTKLKVAGAFHSELMESAVPRVKEVTRRLRRKKYINRLEIPVIANTTGRPITEPWQIERELVRHITKPVRWKQTVEFLEKNGVAVTVEIGKKSILSPMMKDKGKITIGAGLGLGVVAVATFLYFRHRKEK